MEQEIRWKQRFQNFDRALKLLQEVENLPLDSFSTLELEGIIQRYEYTLELSWKTLKDKMEYDGLILERISPKMVFKEAFQAKYIGHIEDWLTMIDERNLLSHKYDLELMLRVVPLIQTKYLSLLKELHYSLIAK